MGLRAGGIRRNNIGNKKQPWGIQCDPNCASCQDTRQSTTGWLLTVYSGATLEQLDTYDDCVYYGLRIAGLWGGG
jgi:hypothetical protein